MAYSRMAADAGASAAYTADELNGMTVAQLRALASERGYTLYKTKKADIIAEILMQQGGEADADL